MENCSKRPKYFNEECLKSALESGFNRNDVKVIKFDINLASFGGENFCSDIYRVKVNYVLETDEDSSVREIHLVLKDMRIEVEQTVKSKEKVMYQQVVPELEKLLGGKEILAPKLFSVLQFDTELYVFQDLNSLGYVLKDRTTGLSEQDCIVLLRKIAKFHAASMVFAEKFPKVIDLIKDHMFQFGTKTTDLLMDDHMTGMIRSAAEIIETWEGYESIAEKVNSIANVFHEKVIEQFNRSKCRYKVINHGDLWVNNVLYKDDDLAFLDLQLSSYGSPAYDVNYFFYTSVPVDILKSKRYELLRVYYKKFEETLKNIDYKQIPSWEDFIFEMRSMEFSGVCTLFTIFPMLCLDKDESKGTNLDTMTDVDAWSAKRRIMFGSKRVEEMFKYSLDRFNDIGALD